jgi:hypothetical protein
VENRNPLGIGDCVILFLNTGWKSDSLGKKEKKKKAVINELHNYLSINHKIVCVASAVSQTKDPYSRHVMW